MTSKSKKIIFTGGGSAGHVTPNIALIEKLREKNWQINYIGSKKGIEKGLIGDVGVPYHAISSGKLRRYFSWQNFFDPFKVILGVFQALFLCFKLKPNVVFSKGGFVSLPVVIAAWILRIPVIIHESDLTVGLTNRLSFPMATKICVTFPDTLKQVKNNQKAAVTGTPIRKEFFSGDAERGRKTCGFTRDKKIISVFGGSLGAEKINQILRKLLPDILGKFQVVHICGKGKVDENIKFPGYKQFEYLYEEFPHVLVASDMVISRSGANSIYELLILRKPNILLPLGAAASRGDQMVNAKYAADKGFSQMILPDQLTKDLLLEKIDLVEKESQKMIDAMKDFEVLPAVDIIVDLLMQE